MMSYIADSINILFKRTKISHYRIL